MTAGKVYYCLNDLLREQPTAGKSAPKPERKETLEPF